MAACGGEPDKENAKNNDTFFFFFLPLNEIKCDILGRVSFAQVEDGDSVTVL